MRVIDVVAVLLLKVPYLGKLLGDMYCPTPHLHDPTVPTKMLGCGCCSNGFAIGCT